jgi:phospholipase/carboxylesterase
MDLEAASSGRLTSRPGDASATSPSRGTSALGHVGLPDTLLHVPTSATAPAPLLVFFHGAGGHAANSLPFVRDAADDSGALVLLPTSAGSTWDLLTGGLGRDVAGVDAALEHLFASCAVSTVALGGFSDGASYALSLALANGDLADAALAFSPGFAAPPRVVGAPRVFVSHGTEDTVLPVDRCGRRVVMSLRGAGHQVHYEEFSGGHVVPDELVRKAFRWWLQPPGER